MTAATTRTIPGGNTQEGVRLLLGAGLLATIVAIQLTGWLTLAFA